MQSESSNKIKSFSEENKRDLSVDEVIILQEYIEYSRMNKYEVSIWGRGLQVRFSLEYEDDFKMLDSIVKKIENTLRQNPEIKSEFKSRPEFSQGERE